MNEFMKKLFFSLILILISSTIFAQKTLTGTVTDANSEPIPGANLVWVGTAAGTTTTPNGEFTIDKPADANRLAVSFIGF